MPALILIAILGVAALAIAMVVSHYKRERERREAFFQIGLDLGLTYHAKDRAIPKAYQFLDALRQGSNRYAFNILEGTYQGRRVKLFDYHYETHSRDSKGRTSTQHHYLSYFILEQPLAFPELHIHPENFFSRLGQMLGFGAITFESVEFSRAFRVRSKNKRFAYDVCHGRMMEFLLEHPDTTLEFEGPCLAMSFTRRLDPARIVETLDRLIAVDALLPEYLRQDLAARTT